ncbi:hypothetical protein GW932_04455 [archaeon]|nr:hypothetical protein [archaeon]
MIEFDETKKARIILDSTRESIESFFELFEKNTNRQAAPANKEIDLLRAALTFAASGLDSTLKQLIRDCLPKLVKLENSEKGFITYIVKELRGDLEYDDESKGRKFLAEILISDSPQEELIKKYVEHLTNGSLQNTQELDKCRSALGINKLIDKDRKMIGEIFQKRNKIIHELDANLTISKKGKRHRNRHSKKDIRKDCDVLLKECETIIKEVENNLK